jgi:hypothetical protein
LIEFDPISTSCFFGTVRHEYIGKVLGDEERERQADREKLDAKWKQARIDAELARQKVHAAKLLELKGELVSKKHVTRQASFLVLSLRARLLAIPAQHASELVKITDERELQSRLDSILRVALDEIAEMPLRVTDERWLEKLDDVEQPAKHRIAK